MHYLMDIVLFSAPAEQAQTAMYTHMPSHLGDQHVHSLSLHVRTRRRPRAGTTRERVGEEWCLRRARLLAVVEGCLETRQLVWDRRKPVHVHKRTEVATEACKSK